MSTYSTYVLSLLPTMYWKLDETSGTALADASGNGHAGSLHGTAGTNYKLNQTGILLGEAAPSIWFDGSNGYGTYPINAIFDNLANFTLMTWYYPQTTSITTGTIAGANLSFNTHFTFSYQGNGFGATVGSGRTWDSAIDYAAPSFPYCVMLQLSTLGLALYLNGVLIGSKLFSAKTPVSTKPFGVASFGGGGNSIQGYFQHMAFWSGTALNAFQIQALYSTGITGYTSPPVGNTQAYVMVFNTTILPANASRKRLTITNDSDAQIWLSLGGTASVNKGVLLSSQGGRFIIDDYTGAVSAIFSWNVGYKNVCIMEET